ncbi:MAG: DNA-protecting protein DprA [Oscillospiraceae bacterium]|nr:DNA-protecting protein DprA [Oscillospiraceae bacterium]
MVELKYWIWMNESGLNPFLARQVMNRLGGPKEVFFAAEGDFAGIEGIRSDDIAALMNKELGHVRRIQEAMTALDGRILSQQDAEYPQRLRDVDDAPLVLYVRGRLPAVDDTATVVIAGTRKCSPYGLAAASRLGGEVTRHGGLVVSGLALGVDAAAAQGALKEGGPVIGVLGCGVERVYPAQNMKLFEAVLENGCLVSEYPPGAEIRGHNFPRRNRIMTGLSLALVAVEIPSAKSGVMHSVNHAIDQGRDVFIVPANIDAPTSLASNALIDEGFQSASTGWQVLREYAQQFPKLSEIPAPPEKAEAWPEGWSAPVKAKTDKKSKRATKKVIDTEPKEDYIDLDGILPDRSEAEQAVLRCLGQVPRHIDEIISETGLPVQKVNVCMTTLGIADYITEHPGKRYSLNPKIRSI